MRKNIARTLTVQNQKKRDAIRGKTRNDNYKPLDMRAKKTRAIRRRLNTTQRLAKTLKQQKKDAYFPVRRIALRA